MTRPKFPVPVDGRFLDMPAKVSPPKGIGRPKGSRNSRTVLIMDAIIAVYRDLQEETGRENGHFLAWAKAHPGEYYKMCLRLLPLQLDAKIDGPRIGTVVFVTGDE